MTITINTPTQTITITDADTIALLTSYINTLIDIHTLDETPTPT